MVARSEATSLDAAQIPHQTPDTHPSTEELQTNRQTIPVPRREGLAAPEVQMRCRQLYPDALFLYYMHRGLDIRITAQALPMPR